MWGVSAGWIFTPTGVSYIFTKMTQRERQDKWKYHKFHPKRVAPNEKAIPNKSMFDIWIPNRIGGLKGGTSLLTLTEGVTPPPPNPSPHPPPLPQGLPLFGYFNPNVFCEISGSQIDSPVTSWPRQMWLISLGILWTCSILDTAVVKAIELSYWIAVTKRAAWSHPVNRNYNDVTLS